MGESVHVDMKTYLVFLLELHLLINGPLSQTDCAPHHQRNFPVEFKGSKAANAIADRLVSETYTEQ